MSAQPKSGNITWSHSHVAREAREELLGHGAATLWFTGLSGSGKSTVALEVERQLIKGGVCAYVLDGDNVRYGLNTNLGFSPEDRTENIRRIGEVAKLFNDAGVIVLTVATTGCEPIELTVTLGPGTHWVVIGPDAFTDAAACGAPYTATLTAPCPPDLDGDGNVATADLLMLLAAWGANPGHPADFDASGVVATADLLALLGNWGACP